MNTHNCPFCGQHSVVTDGTRYSFTIPLKFVHGNFWGDQGTLEVLQLICANSKCKESSFYFCVKDNNKAVYLRMVYPDSVSNIKEFPSYVPTAINNDYKEAQQIIQSSPKAAATLMRRCLQGMIRDYWKITGKANLKQEIDAIQNDIDPTTWDAIEAVRSIGNIGAHMEKDVNLIIDVEQDEAELLLQLIEDLVGDWYITKHEREKRNNALKQAAQNKKNAKLQGVNTPTTP